MALFDMKIHIIEPQVTENMLGILSVRVPREYPQNTAKIAGLYGISAPCAHWHASYTCY